MRRRRRPGRVVGMSRTADLVIAVALIAGGLVLALGFADARFLVFEGRPFGVVLVVVGALELAWTLARRGRSDDRG